ncbi:MAG: DUF4105 domain-containing protein [Dokdonella sp.]
MVDTWRAASRLVAVAAIMLTALLATSPGALAQSPSTATAPAAAVPINTSIADAPEISLVTYGPGEIYWERFGHNAILVRDPVSGEAIAYNYGIFDFDDDDFFWNFARGLMRYRIAAVRFDDDLPIYVDEGRSVTEQRLQMSAQQRIALRDFLRWNTQPENAYYRYDYFTSNCSTKVRDALDQGLGGLLKQQSTGRSQGYTYRIDALRLMSPDAWLMLIVDLGLGPYADQRIDFWQESFVPMTLAKVVRSAQTSGDGATPVALVSEERTLARGRIAEPPELPPDLRWPFLFVGLGSGILMLVLARLRSSPVARVALSILAFVFSLTCCIGGSVLLALWGLTDHRSAWRNENLLLLSPLCLLLLPTWIGSSRVRWKPRFWTQVVAWTIAAIASFALFSKTLPGFVQANLHWIVLFLPIHVALALTIARQRSAIAGLKPS